MKDSVLSPGARLVLAVCLLFLSFAAAFAALPEGEGKAAAGVRERGSEESSALDSGQGSADADWLKSARLAAVSMDESMSEDRLAAILDRLAAEGVTVLVACGSLSNYIDNSAFERHLAFIGRVSKMARARDLRIAWRMPVLRVVTPGGRLLSGRGTMRLDHPEWVQQNADRRGRRRRNNMECLNYYYVKDDEHAWMCPHSGYREHFLTRAARVAAAGVDGLWLSDAVFSAAAGKWPCSDHSCENVFFDETGCAFPAKLSLYDMPFKQWILWRHRTLADLLYETLVRARAENSAVRCIVEASGCDHMGATLEGLDGAWLSPELDVAWNVEPISSTTGMEDASPRDWLSMMITFKYCRGVSGSRPSWAVCHGAGEADGRLVMASALAAQCNPLEREVSSPAVSVGSDFRTRMFSWVKRNSIELFQSQSEARVAVLYSPETRDFVDGVRKGGFYLTPYPPSPAVKWSVASWQESLVQCDYLCEFKGWGMLLARHHIPFDILPANRVAEVDLSRYRALILPNLVCLSSETRDSILGYVMEGGNVLITGEKAGAYSEFGLKLRTGTWADIGKTDRRSRLETLYGKGRVAFIRELPGKLFIYDRGWHIADPCLAFLGESGVAPLIEGKEPLFVQLYRTDGAYIVHLINWGWKQAAGSRPVRARGTMALPLPEGCEVARVVASAPGEQDREIPFTSANGEACFDVDVSVNLLVKVELR